MPALGIGASHVGQQRKRNEDSFHADSELGLFIISDGMGGHAAGDVASVAAVEAAVRVVDEERSLIPRVAAGKEDVEALVALGRRAAEAACREVFQLSQARQEYSGMGGTLTLLLVAGDKAAMAHVGDSRLYMIRGGQAHQLSTDHTLAEELVRGGVMTAEDARSSRYNNVLSRAIGIQEAVQVDTLPLELLHGDRFLLCSDGLSQYIESQQWLANAVGDDQDFDGVPDAMLAHANAAGGSDNIAVVVVRVEAEEAARARPVPFTTDMGLKLEALCSVFLFEGLSMAQLARVLNACEERDLQDSELVLQAGEHCQQLLVVLAGAVQVSRGDVVASLCSGGCLGEACLLRPRRSRATVRADGAGRLLVLHRDAFLELSRERPWLGVTLLQRLGRRLSRDLDRAQDRAPTLDGGASVPAV